MERRDNSGEHGVPHAYLVAVWVVDADTHWLSVTEGPAPETETAVLRIVFSVDPRAVKI